MILRTANIKAHGSNLVASLLSLYAPPHGKIFRRRIKGSATAD